MTGFFRQKYNVYYFDLQLSVTTSKYSRFNNNSFLQTGFPMPETLIILVLLDAFKRLSFYLRRNRFLISSEETKRSHGRGGRVRRVERLRKRRHRGFLTNRDGQCELERYRDGRTIKHCANTNWAVLTPVQTPQNTRTQSSINRI